MKEQSLTRIVKKSLTVNESLRRPMLVEDDYKGVKDLHLVYYGRDLSTKSYAVVGDRGQAHIYTVYAGEENKILEPFIDLFSVRDSVYTYKVASEMKDLSVGESMRFLGTLTLIRLR